MLDGRVATKDGPAPFAVRIKELVSEHGTSISRLYDDAVWAGPGKKPSKGQLDKSMTGHLRVRRDVMDMLTAALSDDAQQVDPYDEFAEYQLAVARDQLDERVVGLDAATANLKAFLRATRSSAKVPGRRTAERQESSQKPTQASPPGRATKRGA